MDERTQVIYVVSFSPSAKSPHGTGGHDWYFERHLAVECMQNHLTDGTERFDYTFVELQVPLSLMKDGNEAITRWIDSHTELFTCDQPSTERFSVMLSRQGTACSETALCSEHDNLPNRGIAERVTKRLGRDKGVEWATGVINEVLECIICGKGGDA